MFHVSRIKVLLEEPSVEIRLKSKREWERKRRLKMDTDRNYLKNMVVLIKLIHSPKPVGLCTSQPKFKALCLWRLLLL